MDDSQAERASANVLYMELLGAKVEKVKVSHFRNRDVREAALDYWSKQPAEAFLLMGLDAAPPPYPVMTQEFTAAIGRELRRQLAQPGKALLALIVTRGSQTADALGLFPAFFGDARTRLVCVEPQAQAEPDIVKAGKADLFNQTGMPLSNQEKKVAQGILDRLEYPSVAREHALLQASGRVEYVETPRSQARLALQELARLEGIIAPVGTAHVLAYAMAEARKLKPEQAVVALMAEEMDSTGWEVRRLIDEGAPAPPRPKGKP
jgi:tryptophan synthase beta chain